MKVFRTAIYEYFCGEERVFNFQHIPVVDYNGHIIQTKYNSSRNKCHLYTINIYHTECSSLVNGKYVQQCLRFDLPELLSRMESCQHEILC